MKIALLCLWLVCVVLMLPPRKEWSSLRLADWAMFGGLSALSFWAIFAPSGDDHWLDGRF